ncbi:MAG: DUF1592 domain-containing protein [Gemmatimonadetes bacterium]|nr:DUF1592 domain-containing protein [Gemmatimonadota bacterium]MDA1103529.1 DUF1592 domain-containing protein [Gemmatimonadota bacterium]
MKTLSAAMAAFGTVLVYAGAASGPIPLISSPTPRASTSSTEITWSAESDNAVIQEYCVRCHSDRRLRGNLSLEAFDADAPHENGDLTEKIIVKLRAGMMPPPGVARPAGDTLLLLVESLERRVDEVARRNPNPGNRTFQRLNQAEYARSVRDLLGLEIDPSSLLPLDTKSANFDNIADVQMLSPTLLDAYLNAAATISRLAVGDPDASPSSTTYTNSGYASQWERADGAPFGTRGGISVTHNFVADGEYEFHLAFEHTTTGGYYGGVTRGEQIEISIDGDRVALIEMDRWMSVADPNGVNQRSEPIFVRAGPHRVSAVFLKASDGPIDDVLSPHDWSLSDRQIGVSGYGITSFAHLKDMVVAGPANATGVSETPSRQRIFTCRPTSAAEERPCARQIVSQLGPRAFRRPLTDDDEAALMRFYEYGVEEGGFEIGVRTVVEAMLASPDFVFRFEEAPRGVEVGQNYRIRDVDLASRLSFFIWGLPPDQQLMEVATSGRLSREDVLEQQVARMIADPRSEALSTRFAAQWLRLDDLDKVHPDRLMFPDFHQKLAADLRRETETFFGSLVREDANVFDLYTADYSYMNERVAKHYGIDGVVGDEFRRVAYPDETRRGLIGHASILTLTSHAGRTSPVLRGKWIMEVIMGTPPPPPPPGVPTLEETSDVSDGRMLTTRERMEQHRENPTCNACHRFMDPIGLALDRYDVTGQWRIRENGMPLDTNGELYDGTPITSPAELNAALVARPIPLVRTFTQNLMAYALGRRVEYYDQPTIRAIVREAEKNDYRMSSFILNVVKSDAFQMQRAGAVADATSQH